MCQLAAHLVDGVCGHRMSHGLTCCAAASLWPHDLQTGMIRLESSLLCSYAVQGFMETAAILEKFAFYQGATRPFRTEMARAGRFVRLTPGMFFYREGELNSHFAVVGTGSIRVFKTGESGREITLYRVRDGETCLVNMLSAFLGQPTVASAVVETPTEVVLFPAETFRAWIASSDLVRKFVFETMARRLVDTMTLVEEIAFRRMDVRLAGLLRQRFATRRIVDATHEALATELGTAREVVSRLLKEFERAGAVELNRGHVLLKDEARLAELSLQNEVSVTKSQTRSRRIE